MLFVFTLKLSNRICTHLETAFSLAGSNNLNLCDVLMPVLYTVSTIKLFSDSSLCDSAHHSYDAYMLFTIGCRYSISIL